jgi:hypothetical protein
VPTPSELFQVALVGAGATAMLDAWQLLLKQAGVPASSYVLVGRWVGHLTRGRLAHDSIAKAEPLVHERGLGWLTHYAVGIAFAGLLVAVEGTGWLRQPTFGPALALGVATVVVPLFLMQPAMGAGFAASKTPAPLRTCLRSLGNHAMFGCGLYLAAVAFSSATR